MFRKKAEKRKDVIKMAKELNLQDVFLNQARKEKIPVTIYITNGFQFKGLVRGFDNYTVILDIQACYLDNNTSQSCIHP